MSPPTKKHKLIEGAEWISSNESSSPTSTQNEAMKESLAVMGNFLVKGQFSDFTIVAGAKGDEQARKIPVHTFVLRAFSSVFEAMLNSSMRENTENCVYINDISYDVLRDVVDFLYTAQASRFDLHPVELLLAADRYDLAKLKVWCAKKIAADITLNRVVEIINAARSVNATSLYNKAKTFIMDPENKRKLIEMEALSELKPDILLDLFISSPSKQH